jgi:hypothetical protein
MAFNLLSEGARLSFGALKGLLILVFCYMMIRLACTAYFNARLEFLKGVSKLHAINFNDPNKGN